MAKIPLDFSLGSYSDSQLGVANREIRDCYIETTPGRNQKPIVRAVEGYTQLTSWTIANAFNNAIIVDDTAYVVAGNSLYTATLSASPTITNRGTVGGGSSPCRMASNGKNIVIVYPQNATPATDYYYDIATTTLATIVSSDADYSSYGRAKDVTFHDGYYFFVTEDNVFHGDNASTGTGIAFDPLSFDTLPKGYGQGVGVESLNGQIATFLSNGTFFYVTAATAPFSFRRNTGVRLDLGLADPFTKTVFDDRCFLVGKAGNSESSPYLLEGTNYSNLGDSTIDFFCSSISFRAQVSSFTVNSHKFVAMQANDLQGIPTESYVFDYTETKLRGYPVWHTRGANGYSEHFPIRKWVTRQDNAASTTNTLYAFGCEPGGALDTKAYTMNPTDIYDSTFVFTMPYFRNGGEPVYIKKMGLKFSDNVDAAELFSSSDGSTFTSLGSYSLSSYDNKYAEWRKINRYSTDVMFKIQFTGVSTSSQLALIEGFVEA